MANDDCLSALNEALQHILRCRMDEAEACAALIAQEQTRNLLLLLCKTHRELNRYAGEISKGNLSTERPPRDNFLAMGLKNLHSKLSHLAWQIGQVTEGDYSQELDFMGTLADGFNRMTQQLRQRREADETIRQMYLQLTKSDEVIKMLRQREKERDEAIAVAIRASKAKGIFLANMSHEMRTPLNAILGMAAIGKNAGEIQKKDEAFKKIETSSAHLLNLVNDVLDMTKLHGEELVLTPASFNFRKMLQNVRDIIAFELENKHQSLDLTVDEAIPENLTGDGYRLAQVITNLLTNAVKFTPEKGMIGLDARLAGEENNLCTLQIAVTDNGIGIAAEQQARLFFPFERLEEDMTSKYGGTGLGLAISSRIVEMMDGKIRVDSSPGKGSTFTFTVRMQRVGVRSEAADTPANPEQKDDFSGFRILLVDDVEINREIVLSILEPMGLEIDCATNGREAVRMFREAPQRYHLIFMDLQMPEMDGLEATRNIRASRAPNALTVPVVAMTANTFKEDVEKCLAAGMNSHLSKPLDMGAVWDTLRDYLSMPKKRANV
ncbi:MAG: response regulator [Desulfovibrio sp.]|nr:response regulator [Desulfovibrio sp.]